MLVMKSVIVEQSIFICFLAFYTIQLGPPNVVGFGALPLNEPGCINNVVILINALKKLTLRQL